MKVEIMKIDEIIEPDFDMKYDQITPKLIKYFDKMAKMSYEYKSFIFYLKNVLDVSRCTYFEGWTMKNGFKLEMHHFPLTMYEYCEIVAKKQLEEQNYIKTSTVCSEVIKLHYSFNVGLIPLNPTAHELYHSGNLDIDPKLVLGDWEGFYKMYKDYIPGETRQKLDDYIELLHSGKDMKFPAILTRQELYLDAKFIHKLNSKTASSLLAKESIKKLEQKTA